MITRDWLQAEMEQAKRNYDDEVAAARQKYLRLCEWGRAESAKLDVAEREAKKKE